MIRIFTIALIWSLLSAILPAQTFTAPGGPIPDDGTIISFDLPVSGVLPDTLDTSAFGLESVCINVTHTWDSDLSVSLRAPDGTVIALFSGVGGDLDGFENTCLSGNADTSIFQAPYPYTGQFRPFGDMGAINNGQSPNGVWQLIILDTYAFADAGTLFDWSVTFGANPCTPFPFESSDLPIIKINTGGQPVVNEPKIDAQLTLIDNAPGERNYLHQDTFAFSGPVGIELHGNSTQSFPKKSFDFETRDSVGEDLDVVLLSLPEGSDFVLSANFSDKTQLRNALSYDLSRRLGQYAGRTRFCEVFLDNTYQGIYVLTEKIRRGAERVDIPKLTATDTAGVELTGGYIVSIDWNDTPGWLSPFSQPNSPNIYTYFQHAYPRWDEILPVQADYIRRYVDSFEVALHGPDFQAPAGGWRQFADEKSFIDFLFVNEMGKNVDGYRLSTYFYKQRDDRGGKLHMGPLWDFDLAWYNADYCLAYEPSDWAFDLNYVCGDAGVPFWWERLLQDSAFSQNMACRWQTLRAGTLRTDSIFAAVDSMAALLQESQARNFQQWPILGAYVWPNPGPLPDSYAGEVEKMKNWIEQRLDWLDFAFGQYEPTLNAEFDAEPASAFDWTFTPALQGNLIYAWDFDDGTTSDEAAPQHQFPGTGTYHVRLTIATPYGCAFSSQQILHIVDVATADAEPAAPLRILPNPAAGRVFVDLPDDFAVDYRILIFNNLGQNVSTRIFDKTARRVTLDVSGLPAGIYQIEAQSAMRRLTGRVVVRP